MTQNYHMQFRQSPANLSLQLLAKANEIQDMLEKNPGWLHHSDEVELRKLESGVRCVGDLLAHPDPDGFLDRLLELTAEVIAVYAREICQMRIDSDSL